MSAKAWRRIALALLVGFVALSTHTVDALVEELADKKGTVKIKQSDVETSTASGNFDPVPDMSTSIATKKDGLLLVRFFAHGQCIDGPDGGALCDGKVQILVDGSPAAPFSSKNFANEESSGGYWALGIERAVDNLEKEDHTISVEYVVLSPTDMFFLADKQLTVQAFR